MMRISQVHYAALRAERGAAIKPLCAAAIPEE